MAPQYGQRKRDETREQHERQIQDDDPQHQPSGEHESGARQTMHQEKLPPAGEEDRFRYDAPAGEFERYGEGFSHGPAYAFPDYGYYARGHGHGNAGYTPGYYGGGYADEQRQRGHQGDFSGRSQHERHPDPDYHQWREEQIRSLDRSFEEYRKARYSRFAEEFDKWRSSRAENKKTDVEK